MPVQAQKVARGIAPPLHNLGARRRRCEQHHAPAALPLCKNSVPIVKEAEWVSEPVWIRSPDHQAQKESPYQLHYAGRV